MERGEKQKSSTLCDKFERFHDARMAGKQAVLRLATMAGKCALRGWRGRSVSESGRGGGVGPCSSASARHPQSRKVARASTLALCIPEVSGKRWTVDGLGMYLD